MADPFEEGKFLLFPRRNEKPEAERGRYEVLSMLWQLRHTIVHNVGVITQSDALKFRLLLQDQVSSPRVIVPNRDDLRYVKRFLDETARIINTRVGERMAELLTILLAANPALFAPKEMADRLTELFGSVLMVAGIPGTLPP